LSEGGSPGTGDHGAERAGRPHPQERSSQAQPTAAVRLRPDGKKGRRGGAASAVSSLTTAELRLLPLLLTHRTFAEISERFNVSPHAVKTQAISVYRKLGASSRSQAVQRPSSSA
jgi:LuxR family transcriptional regulator, maltose regulon positive regulatory protein